MYDEDLGFDPGAIRWQRDNECFPIVNRGQLWYDGLTSDEYDELQEWYLDWLDAPMTGVIPEMPAWLK